MSKSEHIQRPAKNFLQRFSKCNPVSVNISTVPNFPGNWKVSPIRLDFSAFDIEIPHPQIILKFSPADCVFIRQLFNSEHTKLASMHLSHRGQISYYIYYAIYNSNNDFNAFYSRVPQILRKSTGTGTKVRNYPLPLNVM